MQFCAIIFGSDLIIPEPQNMHGLPQVKQANGSYKKIDKLSLQEAKKRAAKEVQDSLGIDTRGSGIVHVTDPGTQTSAAASAARGSRDQLETPTPPFQLPELPPLVPPMEKARILEVSGTELPRPAPVRMDFPTVPQQEATVIE